MPIVVGTLAKHLIVFFGAPRRIVQFVCRIKMLYTGKINHAAKINRHYLRPFNLIEQVTPIDLESSLSVQHSTAFFACKVEQSKIAAHNILFNDKTAILKQNKFYSTFVLL